MLTSLLAQGPILFFMALSTAQTTAHLSAPDGVVSVSPHRGVAGHFGTWVVSYQAGEEGIGRGGGIRVQLPDTWHAGDRNSANPLQATDPGADHYISARTSAAGVRLETEVESQSDRVLVKSARSSLDGRLERYVFVVRVTVLEGDIGAGETLSVVYGDTSHGSRGMRAAIVATDPEPILLAVDASGSGRFELHPDRPRLQSISGPPAELLVSGPSDLVVGRTAQLRLAVVDAHSNPVRSFEDEFVFEVTHGQADLEGRLRLSLEQGWTTVPMKASAEGIVRVKVSSRAGILVTLSNPMRASVDEPAWRIYWGDLHSHSRHSWDGVGAGGFEYARHVAGLDFYARTDHSRTSRDGQTRGLGPHVWEEYLALSERHNDPGEFVTLHGYEASFGAPYGHHNVYFRGVPGYLAAPEKETLLELWQQLEAGQALTVPHHTAKFPRPVSWQHHDERFRRNFEIYSAHGLSEAFDPGHPLAFEQSDFTSPSSSADPGQSAQDAWMAGLVLSTIAASDDHRAQPGKPHWGLAAVMATALTREEIFDGLHRRHTYGTTGARILLDFKVNGARMGQTVESEGAPRIEIESHGTQPISEVEVLRYTDGGEGFGVVHRFEPNSLDFLWSVVDSGFRGDSIYYVRLRQTGRVGDRIAMAWSSPIWVKGK